MRGRAAPSSLNMALDPVTYLRTEWVSAALCTNQTPRSADTCLQLGTEDGRAVLFLPRTIREIITSSLDGELKISARRQLKQQKDRRASEAKIIESDQPVDDLRDTKDESVDVVITLQVAAKMKEHGRDWKKSIQEAARVLKPGGRLLFVEPPEIDGESFLEYIESLMSVTGAVPKDSSERFPIFDEVGWDPIDLVLQPHIAGLAIKSLDAGLTPEERMRKEAREKEEKLAELSIEAYERGLKKRKRKKKASTKEESKASTASS
jgi:SAM-dependent methyltransferase